MGAWISWNLRTILGASLIHLWNDDHCVPTSDFRLEGSGNIFRVKKRSFSLNFKRRGPVDEINFFDCQTCFSDPKNRKMIGERRSEVCFFWATLLILFIYNFSVYISFTLCFSYPIVDYYTILTIYCKRFEKWKVTVVLLLLVLVMIMMLFWLYLSSSTHFLPRDGKFARIVKK